MAYAPEYWVTPTQITVGRMIAALPFALLTLVLTPTQSLCAFIVLALSDTADGLNARRTRRVSARGAFMDPLADKVLVYTYLAVQVPHIWIDLSVLEQACIMILVLLAWALDVRSTIMRTRGIGPTKANKYGKFKTLCQMAAVSACLLAPAHPSLVWPAIALMLVAICCAVSSLRAKARSTDEADIMVSLEIV
jgi:CDP-diacylglycerol--glycerol-3-phosphate 3-phosphatidyltransferase